MNDISIKNKKRFWVAVGCSAGIFILVLVFAIVGLADSVKEMAEITISKMPDTILASSGVVEDEDTLLSVIYYDQKQDDCVNMYDSGSSRELEERQFEWMWCGYDRKQMEQGLVEERLDKNYLPVWQGGSLTPNKGAKDIARWFSAIEGKSKDYVGTLRLKYRADEAEFAYEAEEFYPIDDAKFSLDDTVNEDGYNHLFTMSFAVPFSPLLSGEEEFVITADDDTFVFVNNELVIDMGGVHEAMTGVMRIAKNGEILVSVDGADLVGSGIIVDKNSVMRVYHADRDASESVFGIRFKGMNLEVVEAKIAGVETNVQVAYDPNDPSYIAPLGESAVFLPDKTREYMLLATIEGALIAVLAVFLVIAGRMIAKHKLED